MLSDKRPLTAGIPIGQRHLHLGRPLRGRHNARFCPEFRVLERLGYVTIDEPGAVQLSVIVPGLGLLQLISQGSPS